MVCKEQIRDLGKTRNVRSRPEDLSGDAQSCGDKGGIEDDAVDIIASKREGLIY
jgi:hypothetical protein